VKEWERCGEKEGEDGRRNRGREDRKLGREKWRKSKD